MAAHAAHALDPLFASGDVTLRSVLQDVDVHGDADCLRQVVTNLLSNVLKFTPEGGTVTLSVRPRDGHAELSIADTGRVSQPMTSTTSSNPSGAGATPRGSAATASA